MRSYILTPRERNFVEAFLESQEVAPEDYNSYCVLRHQFRKSAKVLTWDLELLQSFINTTRKPKCFGTEDVVKKTTLRKCTSCDAAAKCLGIFVKSTELIT